MGVDRIKERAIFSLSSDVKNRLEDAVPKRERSRYVERAIDRALREDALQQFSRFLDELPKSSGGENSTEVLRRLRRQWDGRPEHVLDGRDE